MSERLTSVYVPGVDLTIAWVDYGRQPAAKMIDMLKSYALKQRDAAQAVLDAADHEFHVETYVGVHVQRKRETVQKSSRHK